MLLDNGFEGTRTQFVLPPLPSGKHVVFGATNNNWPVGDTVSLIVLG